MILKDTYSIKPDDWSDAYILRYQPGAMGDFLGSLFLHYFYNAKNIKNTKLHSIDSFGYDIVNQKWVCSDSSGLRIRSFFRHKEKEIKFLIDVDTGKRCLELHSDLYQLEPDEIQELNSADLVYRLLDCKEVRLTKNTEIPYLFSIEGAQLLKFENFKLKDTALILPGINLIELTSYRNTYSFITWLLLAYKERHANEYFYIKSEEQLSNVKEFFIDSLMLYNEAYYFGNSAATEIEGYGSRQKIDYLRLVYENDTQGLEFIDLNEPTTKRMMETARRDADEILNYFGVDYYNIKPLAEYGVDNILNKWLKLLRYDRDIFKNGILINS